MIFELNYWVKNCGDGSAVVKFEDSSEEAERADENQSEGWGESSADAIELKLENDKLYRRSYEMVDGKYSTVWKEIVPDRIQPE